MASAWGAAWASAWGNSWGSGSVVPPVVEITGEGGPPRFTAVNYSREKHRALMQALRNAKKAAKKHDKPRKKHIEEPNEAVAHFLGGEMSNRSAELHAAVIAATKALDEYNAARALIEMADEEEAEFLLLIH